MAPITHQTRPESESRFQRWWFFFILNPGALPQAVNETAPLAQHNPGTLIDESNPPYSRLFV